MTRIFLQVLSHSFYGSIAIAVVLVLRLLLRKAPKKFLCLLWIVAGVRLLMPIDIETKLSLVPKTQTQVIQVQDETLYVEAPELPVVFPEPQALPEISQQVPVVFPESPAAPENAPVQLDWLAIAAWAWVAVVFAFGLHMEFTMWRLRRRVRFAVQIEGGWESENIDTAFILTGFRPKIYIPMGMNETDKKYILAHEQAHLDRGDGWIKGIAYLMLAFHWFNPLVWVAYVCLCRDIELACDERVVQFMNVQERKEYSAALLKCSANKAHFLSSPVAFGEVSVKNRILTILSYKKPGFWISLLGIAAIAFVGVCLVTSPMEEEEPSLPPPMTTEPTVAVTETAVSSTFASALTSEAEILEAVTAGIRELENRESYRVHIENHVTHSAREEEGNVYISDIYRYGNDKLELCQTDFGTGTLSLANSSVLYGDLYGLHYGDYWVNEGTREENNGPDVHHWLTYYAPEVNTVTGAKVVSGDTVCMDMQWDSVLGDGVTGTVLVTFREDGTIAKILRSYRGPEGEEGYFLYDITVNILDDPAPQQTWRMIADHAMQCISREELEQVRNARNEMTEIPSNKTDYDQDVTTGSISKQWEFLDKSWHCRIGSTDVTPTGLQQTFEESGDGHASFTVEEGFWLETFDGENWCLLREPLELSPAESKSVSVTWETKDSFLIDWSDSYGTLPEGYYRLGRYYTVTMPDGRSETLPCYCKFQIRNQDVETLLKECEMGVTKLVNSTDYYLKCWNYLRNEEFHHRLDADSHDMVKEVWRNGEDFYQETTYRYKSDGTTKDIIAYLRRGGKGYCTAEKTFIQSMDEAEFTEVDWVDAHTFDNWSAFAVLFSPTDIVEVYKDQRNVIHVRESTDFYDGIPFEEQRYSFTDDGTLVHYQRVFFDEAGTEYIDFELERYRTAEGETRRKIDSISVD
ncbi:MAG: M56 family metallopeptidase [Oscillospiraceae bacterium]|nr:M56 family metallopeptidase [Oscillospiraceae bacterium]